MWPNARISVMGAQQATQVLITIKKDQSKAKNMEVSKDELKAIENQIMEKYEAEGSPWYSTSRLWDDGIIDPVETRDILGLTLQTVSRTRVNKPKYGIFRM
jgi:acetyl-CoA carboxylase carboxyltransferase component